MGHGNRAPFTLLRAFDGNAPSVWISSKCDTCANNGCCCGDTLMSRSSFSPRSSTSGGSNLSHRKAALAHQSVGIDVTSAEVAECDVGRNGVAHALD